MLCGSEATLPRCLGSIPLHDEPQRVQILFVMLEEKNRFTFLLELKLCCQ